MMHESAAVMLTADETVDLAAKIVGVEPTVWNLGAHGHGWLFVFELRAADRPRRRVHRFVVDEDIPGTKDLTNARGIAEAWLALRYDAPRAILLGEMEYGPATHPHTDTEIAP